MPFSKTSVYFNSLFVFISLFSACSTKAKNDLAIINELDLSINSSNRTINISTVTIMKALQDKLYDQYTREKAGWWFPKAEQVVKYSKNMYDYIESLKQAKSFTADKINTLDAELKNYKEELLKIDSTIRFEFENSIVIPQSLTDTSNFKQKDFYTTFFKNSSIEASLALLSKFQNNVKIAENKLVYYCFSRCGSMGRPFEVDSPLITQNSSLFKPGGQLQIKAGVGFFTKKGEPVVTINNKSIEIGENGYASYKTKTPLTPGKYKVPVRVSFTSEITGKNEAHEVTVEYTVTKECGQ